MIFEWETHDQRLRRFMKISPQRKLEWLQQMHEFMLRTSSKRVKAIRLELKRKRQDPQ
ncbi:MAG: hypothetical protein HZA28_01540 [Candidatus Omnitrophica bacterium]|nr:hypothetical protein [Candidatus Omnitrophota bacterium]